MSLVAGSPTTAPRKVATSVSRSTSSAISRDFDSTPPGVLAVVPTLVHVEHVLGLAPEHCGEDRDVYLNVRLAKHTEPGAHVGGKLIKGTEHRARVRWGALYAEAAQPVR